MAEPDNFDTRDRQHIPIDVFRETAAYTFPSRNQERKPLRGNYAAHAAYLLDQLATALGDVPLPADDPRLAVQGLKSGTIVETALWRQGDWKRSLILSLKGNTKSPALAASRGTEKSHRRRWRPAFLLLHHYIIGCANAARHLLLPGLQECCDCCPAKRLPPGNRGARNMP